MLRLLTVLVLLVSPAFVSAQNWSWRTTQPAPTWNWHTTNQAPAPDPTPVVRTYPTFESIFKEARAKNTPVVVFLGTQPPRTLPGVVTAVNPTGMCGGWEYQAPGIIVCRIRADWPKQFECFWFAPGTSNAEIMACINRQAIWDPGWQPVPRMMQEVPAQTPAQPAPCFS